MVNSNQKKTIGFYINTIQYGGAERLVACLANFFGTIGYRVYVMTSYLLDDEYRLEDRVTRVVLNQSVLSSCTVKKNAEWITEIRAICKKKQIDYLIGFLREGNFRVISATLGIRTKSIIYNCGQPEVMYNTFFDKLIMNFILPLADLSVYELEMERLFFPKRMLKKSEIITHGIPDEFFDVSRVPKKNQLVSIGRLDPIKNLPLLIKAVRFARDSILDIDLKIYGRGPDKGRLEKAIDECGANEFVHLMGTTDSVVDALKEADLFVLTSDSEGLPTTLMEAMSMGIPCIATDCPVGGPRWLIDDHKSGMLVSKGDVVALTTAIVEILSDRAILEKIGINARERAQEFRAKKVLKKWQSIIEEIQ